MRGKKSRLCARVQARVRSLATVGSKLGSVTTCRPPKFGVSRPRDELPSNQRRKGVAFFGYLSYR
eukprot:4030132-Pyramimonas_sp.AAC.1